LKFKGDQSHSVGLAKNDISRRFANNIVFIDQPNGDKENQIQTDVQSKKDERLSFKQKMMSQSQYAKLRSNS
jgi:hypothetical protein